MPALQTPVFPAATSPQARGRSGAARPPEKGFSEPQICRVTMPAGVSHFGPLPSLPSAFQQGTNTSTAN